MVGRIAASIRGLGHEVRICGLSDGRGALRYWRHRRRVGREIVEFQPDIIHVHFGYSTIAVPRTQLQMVTSFYGDDLNGTVSRWGGISLKSRLGILVSQVAARRSARCIVVSKALRDRLWSHALREKTDVVRDSVDPRLFRPISRQIARERLDIKPDVVLILFPHDITQPTKRLWLAQEAVRELESDCPTARLWVVNNVDPSEMPFYYAAADAMVITSAREGGPSSAKEALACGTPVVSVSVGDLDLFDEAPDGMHHAEPTPTGLAAVLRAVIQTRSTQRRSYLPSDLTLEMAAGRIVAVYREVLRGSSRSPMEAAT